ncbi:tetratricopeptide repeat protein [Rhizobium sp. P32RR-XVIII]|uniref:adenylate/guanylate cyclase domain-containing protein n=1 Tax=Rhizobium sp. P32RR-XVIII TaxID=2726738 RepID=UPI00145674E8|nr:tetratricopeptide repeat protein [Rhizobium sp. P32RR-XVIII]NLS02182.1 tetratricopeptide repeat protein [Rhizobium sp. P32RR-XVIII]
MERRLVAVLAADVAGYSRLMESDEEATTATLFAYRTVAREVIVVHRGRIFNTAGDSIVAEFHSIVDALRCAVEIQHEIEDRNASVPENRRMRFRIGVNLGDMIAEENHLYGTGVNVAARLEQMAEPGGICISQPVYDQVRRVVEMAFEDIGECRLKNISDPVHVYRLLPEQVTRSGRLALPYSRRRLGLAAAFVALLLMAIVGGSYLLWPSAVQNVVFGDKSSLPEHSAIAILPFDDLSPKADQQYLADGITEELSTALAKFPDLTVMARSSTAAYKDKALDIRKIAKDLNVHYIVGGTLQRSDHSIRVTAQLIDADSGRQIWADRYDRQLDNIFEVRDDIARSIAGSVMGTHGKLADAELARLAGKNPNSFTAYDYLMKGWQEWSNFTREGNLAARSLFEKARQVDPNYARAYAGLAWTYSLDYDFDWTDNYDETLRLTLEMAEKAVRLDSSDYRSHWVLGWAYLYHHEYDKAMASYSRARDLNPNDAELLAEMANLLIYVGQPEQAVAQLKEAIRLNPFHEDWYVEYLGWAYQEAGMPSEAVTTLEEVVNPNPTEEQLWLLPSLAAAYADPKVGRTDDAHKIVKEILTLDPTFSSAGFAEARPYKLKEQRDRRVETLRRAGLPN